MAARWSSRVALVAVAGLLAVLGGCISNRTGARDPGTQASGTVTSQHYEGVVSLRAPSPGSAVEVVPTAPTVVRIEPVGPSPAGSPAVRYASLAPDRTSSPSAPGTSSPPAPGTSSPPAPGTSSPPAPGTSSPPTHRTPAPPPSGKPTSPAPFHSSISRIDDALAARMHASYRTGCPVPLADLRYLRLSYWGFDRQPHTGEMVVSATVARDVVTAFRYLYSHHFPIHRMSLVDDFGGSDDASMAADNTSAFNCRPITGGTGWSEHSYGDAIDINPVENPYLSGSTVLPPAGAAFLDRPDRPGVIHPGGVAVRAFAAIGWTWGGTWTSPVDLQHFSLSGR